MSSTTHRKYDYFQSTEQTAEDRRQKFHYCRLTYRLACVAGVKKGR